MGQYPVGGAYRSQSDLIQRGAGEGREGLCAQDGSQQLRYRPRRLVYGGMGIGIGAGVGNGHRSCRPVSSIPGTQAMIVRPCGELHPIVRGNRVAGVETPAGTWRCAFVIDATGRQRWLARALNLQTERHGPPRVAWFGYAEGQCPVGRFSGSPNSGLAGRLSVPLKYVIIAMGKPKRSSSARQRERGRNRSVRGHCFPSSSSLHIDSIDSRQH